MTKLRSFPAKVRTFNTSKVKPAPKMVDPFYLKPEWRSLMDAIIKRRAGDAKILSMIHRARESASGFSAITSSS